MNARLKLVITAILLCLALALTVFCAMQTVQAFQRFQQQHQLVVTEDVRAIRSWMTLPYIAHFYHVPESYLDQSLHISNDPTAHLLPLRDLASHIKRPLDSLIRDVQHAILNYRKHQSGTRVTESGRRPQGSRSPRWMGISTSIPLPVVTKSGRRPQGSPPNSTSTPASTAKKCVGKKVGTEERKQS